MKKQDKKQEGKAETMTTVPINSDTESSEGSGKSSEISIRRLEGHLNERYDFRYNEVFKEVEYNQVKGSSQFVTLDEERELPEMRTNLARSGYKSFKTLLSDLTKSRSFSPSFHPFINYFESLPKWNNGDTDHIADLCQYIKVKDQDWFNQMFKKHLVRTVACAIRKIPFNKQCFVLQGQQNDGKTSFLRFLCPIELQLYFKQNPELLTKDSNIALAHNLLILLDELDQYESKDISKVKSLFSESDNKIRSHYGKRDTLQTRYASFFATINKIDFLEDVTGNVRWLVFEVLDILHDDGGRNGYVGKVKIDNVWAQAYSLAKSDFRCELTREEIASLNIRNRFFEKSFPEKELIQKYFEPSEDQNEDSFFLTSTEITQCITYLDGSTIRISPNMIGKGLAALGFKREQGNKQGINYRVWGYHVRSQNYKISHFIESTLLTYSKEYI